MSRLVLPNQEFVLKRHKFHDGRVKRFGMEEK